jgi:N-acetylmuramic acid 6-phosphate etherase
MIKMGKTYSNLMVNVKAINKKLENRVREIVQLATEADLATIEAVLENCNYDPKIAIIVIKSGINVEDATNMINKSKGKVSEVLKELGQ